jgi:hypothetical protein
MMLLGGVEVGLELAFRLFTAVPPDYKFGTESFFQAGFSK